MSNVENLLNNERLNEFERKLEKKQRRRRKVEETIPLVFLGATALGSVGFGIFYGIGIAKETHGGIPAFIMGYLAGAAIGAFAVGTGASLICGAVSELFGDPGYGCQNITPGTCAHTYDIPPEENHPY